LEVREKRGEWEEGGLMEGASKVMMVTFGLTLVGKAMIGEGVRKLMGGWGAKPAREKQ